jgi:hypothetical protein
LSGLTPVPVSKSRNPEADPFNLVISDFSKIAGKAI